MAILRTLDPHSPAWQCCAEKVRVELDNVLYELQMLKATQGTRILRKAIKEIKAAHPDIWQRHSA